MGLQRSRVSLQVLSMITFAAMPLLAQFDTADVLGTIRDSSNGVVSKATVTLVNQDTGIQAKTITASDGSYTFSNVKIGTYTVTAEANGFTKAVAANIVLNVNARQRVDITMQVGVVTDSVQVTGAAAALETDSSEHGQVISAAAVAELPLNGRNYAELALLSTNVIKSPMA